MRILFAIAIYTTLTLTACSLALDSNYNTATINTEHLTQHWVHSVEEQETNDIQIYRPHDYKEFPPSRFRMQYIFYKNEECKWFYLSPNDAHHFKSGNWFISSEDSVIYIEKDHQLASYQIVELTGDLLRMTRTDVN